MFVKVEAEVKVKKKLILNLKIDLNLGDYGHVAISLRHICNEMPT